MIFDALKFTGHSWEIRIHKSTFNANPQHVTPTRVKMHHDDSGSTDMIPLGGKDSSRSLSCRNVNIGFLNADGNCWNILSYGATMSCDYLCNRHYIYAHGLRRCFLSTDSRRFLLAPWEQNVGSLNGVWCPYCPIGAKRQGARKIN